MDVDAVLARTPRVALVDELAHTNVPGSRNEKRWQDIEELLDAGIDVISTVNIQHLESVNDVVEKITGVPQQERVPDAVVRAADQVELVDMAPEALRRRLAHGNVYAATKVDAALANYFRVGNLTALRELALLWTADKVDEALQHYRAEHEIEGTWETRERVVVALTGGPEGETLIRRAARIAARSAGGDLLAVHVTRSDGLTGASPAHLAAQRRLVETLGGTYHQVVGDNVADALLEFARAENATQLVLGGSRRSRLSALFSGPGIGASTIRGSGDIDVHIVTHAQMGKGRGLPQLKGSLTVRRRLHGIALAITLPPLLTLLLTPHRGDLNLVSDVLLFLLVVVVVALVGGFLPAMLAAVAGSLLLNYYFAPPLHDVHDQGDQQCPGVAGVHRGRGVGQLRGRPRSPPKSTGSPRHRRVGDARHPGRQHPSGRDRAAGPARADPRGLRADVRDVARTGSPSHPGSRSHRPRTCRRLDSRSPLPGSIPANDPRTRTPRCRPAICSCSRSEGATCASRTSASSAPSLHRLPSSSNGIG